MYKNGIDSEYIFDENNELYPNADTLVNNPERNGYVRIKFHWSEDPKKDDTWYQEQCRDLNFNTRLINQELDLVFRGSTTCIFDDDFLGALQESKPVAKLNLPHAAIFNFYTSLLDPDDYLLIGVDTAKSITGDYQAIEVFQFSDFQQVGEFFGKLGSVSKFSDAVIALANKLYDLTNGRIILCIENNNMGTAVLEKIEECDDAAKLLPTIYHSNPDKYTGINTNQGTKQQMISYFYDIVTENPKLLKSPDLIPQLHLIERRVNGAVAAKSGEHDDLFMASCLCAFVRTVAFFHYAGDIKPLVEQKTDVKNMNVNNLVKREQFESDSIQAIFPDSGLELQDRNLDEEDDDGLYDMDIIGSLFG